MDEKIIEKYKKAGSIAKKVLTLGKKLVKEGESFLKVGDTLEKEIFKLGGKPAFPVHFSINEDAAHDIPTMNDKRVFKKGDLVKIDVGVHIDGHIGDTAGSVEVSTDKYKDLIKASEDAVKAGLDQVKIGVPISKIGKAIQDAISKYKYTPIINLSGHLVDEYEIHAGLTIPNYDNKSNKKLEEGMAVAIEPFATNGVGRVIDTKNSETFRLTQIKPIRSIFARKILKYIEKEYKTLPFAKRWLLKEFKPLIIESGINELLKADILHNYPILKEESKGIVSQTEHTILVLDKPIITTI